jgi:hypothetical protein
MKAVSPIAAAADWADRHPLVTLPIAVLGAFEGNEGPIEADEAVAEERVTNAADAIEKWLGEGYTKFESPTSDLALKSADGTRTVRFDLTNPHGLAPHVNIQTWQPRNLYPGDRAWDEISNIHVFLP